MWWRGFKLPINMPQELGNSKHWVNSKLPYPAPGNPDPQDNVVTFSWMRQNLKCINLEQYNYGLTLWDVHWASHASKCTISDTIITWLRWLTCRCNKFLPPFLVIHLFWSVRFINLLSLPLIQRGSSINMIWYGKQRRIMSPWLRST